jgi:hypothetical protein
LNLLAVFVKGVQAIELIGIAFTTERISHNPKHIFCPFLLNLIRSVLCQPCGKVSYPTSDSIKPIVMQKAMLATGDPRKLVQEHISSSALQRILLN